MGSPGVVVVTSCYVGGPCSALLVKFKYEDHATDGTGTVGQTRLLGGVKEAPQL